MARKFTPKVITANALVAGDVIYLTTEQTWTRTHAEAALFTDEDLANQRLKWAATDNQIVGVYLADAVSGENGPEPIHFREAFRTRGPSNYFHGKQEGVQDV